MNSENTEIPALPLVSARSLPSYTLHIVERGGWYLSPFYISSKHIISSWLDEKFAEESRISSLLVPILFPALPSCFTCVTLFPKFVPRLLNSLLFPPGPPLLNPKASIWKQLFCPCPVCPFLLPSNLKRT